MSIGITFMGNYMGKSSMSGAGCCGVSRATGSASYMLMISSKRVQASYLILCLDNGVI